MIELGYGARPLRLTLPPGLEAEVLPPPSPPPLTDLRAALAEALAHPIGSRPLREVATARTRAVVIVSDASRDEPRAELFAAVRAELGARPPTTRSRWRWPTARTSPGRWSGSGCRPRCCGATGW